VPAKTLFIHSIGSGIVKHVNFKVLKEMKDKLAKCRLNAMVQRSDLN